MNHYDPSRETLVFIHGLSSSSSAWRDYEKKFEAGYNVLSFDLRGHGKSSKPRDYESYAIKDMAEDLFELKVFLGIETFIMISHSFGTLVALEYLALHQDTLRAAVFLSPDYKVGRRKSEKILRPFLDISSVLGIFPFSSKPARHIDYDPYLGTGDWNLRRLWADIKNTGLRVYLYCTRQSYRFDRSFLLREIRIPVLLVHGKNDSIFPMANSLHMAAEIPGARLLLLDRADHIIVLNKSRELLEAIEIFLSENVRHS
jgi:pimeloyl-ACP methyl ester carboxylesterase